MKAILIFCSVFLGSICSLPAQTKLFPTNEGNPHNGYPALNTDYIYSVLYHNEVEVLNLVPVDFTISQSDNADVRIHRLVDMTDALYEFAKCEYSMIDCKLNSGRTDFDYYLAEYRDSTTGEALAIEYGSARDKITNPASPIRVSKLINLKRVDYFGGQCSPNQTENLIFKSNTGSYLYEIVDAESGRLLGIRYFSTNNNKEYTYCIATFDK